MPLHDWSRVDAGIFHDFHLTWIGLLKTALNGGLLPEPFYALAEPVLGEAIPDVLTLKARGDTPDPDESAAGLLTESSGSAVGLAPCPVLVQDLGPLDAYSLLQRHIEIRDRLREDEVVAVIELVSRANKASQADCEQFVAKAMSLLRSGVHLLIVDLQPPTPLVPDGFYPRICESFGTRPLELPPDRKQQAASYEVIEQHRVRAQVVPLKAGDELPQMPLFLRPRRFIRVPLEPSYGAAFASLPRKFREVLAAESAPTPHRES